jgi:hypothetical protein
MNRGEFEHVVRAAADIVDDEVAHRSSCMTIEVRTR